MGWYQFKNEKTLPFPINVKNIDCNFSVLFTAPKLVPTEKVPLFHDPLKLIVLGSLSPA